MLPAVANGHISNNGNTTENGDGGNPDRPALRHWKNKLTVLLIDESENHRVLGTAYRTAYGAETTSVTDGRAGLELIFSGARFGSVGKNCFHMSMFEKYNKKLSHVKPCFCEQLELWETWSQRVWSVPWINVLKKSHSTYILTRMNSHIEEILMVSYTRSKNDGEEGGEGGE